MCSCTTSKLIKVKRINGNDIWVNPNHIIKIEEVFCKEGESCFILYLVNTGALAVEGSTNLWNILNEAPASLPLGEI